MSSSWLKKVMGALTVGALAMTVVVAQPAAEPAHAATSITTAHKYAADINTIFKETNKLRAAAGKSALKYNHKMTVVAYNWSAKMGGSVGLAHNGNYSKQIPSGWSRAGENVAYACHYGKDSAKIIVDNLRKSSGHYKNMIGDYNSVGLGVKWVGDCLWVTQNFAKYSKPVSNTLPGAVAKDYSYKYPKSIAAAKKASSTAASAKSSAAKSLATAKSSLATAKKYAASKKATSKTKSEYKKAKADYETAKTEYSRTSSRAASAKSAYASVKKYAKAGSSSKVKSYLSTAKSKASGATTSKSKTTIAKNKVVAHTAAAKKAMRK